MERPDGRSVSIYVDEEVYNASIHATEGCISCHADIEELPHAEQLETPDCAMCHDITEIYEQSVHGIALQRGDTDVALCNDCHGTHDIRPSTDPLSRVNPHNLPETCGKCHSNPVMVKQHMVTINHPSESYLKGVHGKAIMEDRNADAATCNDCHGTHDMQPSQLSTSRINALNIPTTCGQCHEEEMEEFQKSIHGLALAAGIPDAPNCATCHGEHEIIAPAENGSPTNAHNVARATCLKCHAEETIMERYGVETHRAASYMDSYHGLSTGANAEVEASCVDCHGIHGILSREDPASPVHPDNVVQTCAKCHENAGPNYAAGPVHIMPTSSGQWIYGLVRLIYLWMIALVLGGMFFHNALLFLRAVLNKVRAKKRNPELIRRFTKAQVLVHLLLGLSFTGLAVSGFALRFPDSWFTEILFLGDMGLEYRGLVHRVMGVVMTGVSAISLLYLMVTRHGRREVWALMLRPKDIGDLFRTLAYGFGLRSEPGHAGRFGYAEKLEFWGLCWGTLIMVVTGFCMWYAHWFLTLLPKVILDIMALVHYYEAWLAVGTIIIWHLYFVVFDPSVYPINLTCTDGMTTREHLQEHHPLDEDAKEPE